MKNNAHCGSEFPGMNEFSGVKINADEVRAVAKKFERQMKSGRVFFPEDAPFAMKCETLLNNAASEVDWLSVSERSFSATDKQLYMICWREPVLPFRIHTALHPRRGREC